jgi:arsenite-transporting ATPase
MSRLKEILDKQRPKIVIFAGKGGLGKTTCSAGLSFHYSSVEGKKTLCFSTDPQASLSDIFETPIFGRGEIEVAPNLFVTEIDADNRITAYQNEIKQKIRDMYKLNDIPKEIDEYINSTSAEPAMYESATYDAMTDLVARKTYDVNIFDMPPFGHGVRMVAMASMLTNWVEKITEARKEAQNYESVAATLRGGVVSEDAVLSELTSIREKLTLFTDLLKDREKTAFFMVLTPEDMAIQDTDRAVEMFKALDLKLSGVIVNQVYPPDLIENEKLSEFLRHKIQTQRRHLDEIKRKYGDKLVAVLPMYPREPKGLRMIQQVSSDLMANAIQI